MPKAAPAVLDEQDGMRYVVATGDHGDAIVRVLSESFAREPMAAALGVSARDLAGLIERFMPECTANGLSVVAAPVDEPTTVAGAFVCRDYRSPLPAGVPDDFPWFLPVAHALGAVNEAYEATQVDLQPGDAVDLWMVGVSEARFARRGIAGRLFRFCADVAHARGFGRCITECTGHYSQTAARRAGFTEAARLAYREFQFEGRAVFARVPEPHTHLILYERALPASTGTP